ncbi:MULTISPECIES: hypothetical protein [Aeribacillus]|jgi:hypothetical protein|uniref:Yip1 domain-containing protein n=2 Tax=Aeribacillus TaxID=1055323 RepID=A0A164AKT7_9BACI|nr:MULTISPECIES: hypothetical protein [Aeribacillus]REJ21576.1 MAG: hypothetical protein C6W54_17075 [Bacillaceae bacterium]KZM56334.1 hypothetical protein A3Q35_08615 [Aeribacillus pallidus]KZN96853.1 hypothetical protein AZI98_04540 [Aeribacillus pallidus]MDR9798149.1 hypothetical protein [Aeribacillus pallidus]MED0650220.1 hypothetical protein [Aeribacillus composti]
MVKLKANEKILLILFTLWYLLSIQFISQYMIMNQGSVIYEKNIFKTKEIMFVFLNFVIMIFSIVFLFFQAFIYRFIILLFKPQKYPSIFSSFFYLMIGYLPFSITIIITNFIHQEYVYNISTNIYAKIFITIIVNVIYIFIIVKKNIIDSKKALLLCMFLIVINALVLFINFNSL